LKSYLKSVGKTVLSSGAILEVSGASSWEGEKNVQHKGEEQQNPEAQTEIHMATQQKPLASQVMTKLKAHLA
jgi:hypothetical protein